MHRLVDLLRAEGRHAEAGLMLTARASANALPADQAFRVVGTPPTVMQRMAMADLNAADAALRALYGAELFRPLPPVSPPPPSIRYYGRTLFELPGNSIVTQLSGLGPTPYPTTRAVRGLPALIGRVGVQSLVRGVLPQVVPAATRAVLSVGRFAFSLPASLATIDFGSDDNRRILDRWARSRGFRDAAHEIAWERAWDELQAEINRPRTYLEDWSARQALADQMRGIRERYPERDPVAEFWARRSQDNYRPEGLRYNPTGRPEDIPRDETYEAVEQRSQANTLAAIRRLVSLAW